MPENLHDIEAALIADLAQEREKPLHRFTPEENLDIALARSLVHKHETILTIINHAIAEWKARREPAYTDLNRAISTLRSLINHDLHKGYILVNNVAWCPACVERYVVRDPVTRKTYLNGIEVVVQYESELPTDKTEPLYCRRCHIFLG